MKKDFSSAEKKLIGGMGLLMGIRMLGISMIIPVFSIFATGISGSTHELAGVAVGIYGISQTIFQIPLGRLSDRWGRKQATLLGLTIFFIGTVLSGISTNIYHLIVSRFIAGAGAVSGITMAWLTDGIDTDRRNAALSLAGISIGVAVIAGFTLSPAIAGYLGIPYLFHTCAAITLVSILFTMKYLENHRTNGADREGQSLRIRNVALILKNPDILRLNAAGLVGNMSLTGMFFIMPLLIKEEFGLLSMWKIYVPMALTGTVCMYFFGRQADRIGTVRIAAAGFAFEIAGALLSLVSRGPAALIAAFMLFYIGHCIISPVLPAAVSKHPSEEHRGTVMGIFNSSQFIGSGLGGLACGILYSFSPDCIFLCITVVILILLYAFSGFRNYSS